MKNLLLYAAAGAVVGLAVGGAVQAIEKRDPDQPFEVPSALVAVAVGLKPALVQMAAPLLVKAADFLNSLQDVPPAFTETPPASTSTPEPES